MPGLADDAAESFKQQRLASTTRPVYARRLSADESAAYFLSRPRASQIGAWGSRQSSTVEGAAELDEPHRTEDALSHAFSCGLVSLPIGALAGRGLWPAQLLAHRAGSSIVPERMTHMEAAYHARDFASFAKLAMRDSNQFHATCLDTFPPIFYMNDTSRAIVQMVHASNEACGEVRPARANDGQRC